MKRFKTIALIVLLLVCAAVSAFAQSKFITHSCELYVLCAPTTGKVQVLDSTTVTSYCDNGIVFSMAQPESKVVIVKGKKGLLIKENEPIVYDDGRVDKCPETTLLLPNDENNKLYVYRQLSEEEVYERITVGSTRQYLTSLGFDKDNTRFGSRITKTQKGKVEVIYPLTFNESLAKEGKQDVLGFGALISAMSAISGTDKAVTDYRPTITLVNDRVVEITYTR